MKKLSVILLGSAISLALVTGVFAETAKDTTKTMTGKTTTKAATTKTETAKPAAKTETAKPAAKTATVKKHQLTGTVTAIDAAANTVTVEKKVGKKTESMTFTAGEKVKLADIKKDSKVIVSYTTEGDKSTASSVKEVVTKTASAKKSTKKAEKKSEEKSEK